MFCCAIFVVWIFCLNSDFVLLNGVRCALRVFMPDYAEHGAVPSPRQLFESTQSRSHIFPTSVSSASEKTGNNKILAEHFSFTGHMHNATSIKKNTE